jgi:hypothetical protein
LRRIAPTSWRESVRGGGTDPLGCLVDVHPPQPYGLVGAAGGQGVPIGAEYRRVDGAGVAGVADRKRMVLANALSYAVELHILQANPLPSVKWTRPKAAQVLDRRSVANPVQARTLLNGVRQVQRSGPRLVPLFGAMYFAALRPEEAVNLRERNLALPAQGWALSTWRSRPRTPARAGRTADKPGTGDSSSTGPGRGPHGALPGGADGAVA